MKTYDVMKMGKGFYVDARIGGRLVEKSFFSKEEDLKTKINTLRADGYVESK